MNEIFPYAWATASFSSTGGKRTAQLAHIATITWRVCGSGFLTAYAFCFQAQPSFQLSMTV